MSTRLSLHGFHGWASLVFCAVSFALTFWVRDLSEFEAWHAVIAIGAILILTPVFMIWGMIATARSPKGRERWQTVGFSALSLVPAILVVVLLSTTG